MVVTWPRMATVRTKKRTDAREENKGGENFREVTRLGQARAAKRNQDSLYSMSKKVTSPQRTLARKESCSVSAKPSIWEITLSLAYAAGYTTARL